MTQDINIKIEKQDYTFSFGLNFIGEVLERTDLDYNDLLQKVIKNPFKYAPILMYESLKNTAKRDKTKLELTEDEFITLLEKQPNLGTDIIMMFVYAFFATNENPTPTESVEKGNVKKK